MPLFLIVLIFIISCLGCSNITAQSMTEATTQLFVEEAADVKTTSVVSYGDTYVFTYSASEKTLEVKINEDTTVTYYLDDVYKIPDEAYEIYGECVFTGLGVGYTVNKKKIYIDVSTGYDGEYIYNEKSAGELGSAVVGVLDKAIEDIVLGESKLYAVSDDEVYREVSNLIFLLKYQQLDVFWAALATCDFELDVKIAALELYLDMLKFGAYIG